MKLILLPWFKRIWKKGVHPKKQGRLPKQYNTLPIYIYSHYKPKHITYKEPKKHSYIKSSSVFSFWSFQIWEKKHLFFQPIHLYLSFPGGVIARSAKIGKGATLTFVHQVGTIFPQTSGLVEEGWFFWIARDKNLKLLMGWPFWDGQTRQPHHLFCCKETRDVWHFLKIRNPAILLSCNFVDCWWDDFFGGDNNHPWICVRKYIKNRGMAFFNSEILQKGKCTYTVFPGFQKQW